MSGNEGRSLVFYLKGFWLCIQINPLFSELKWPAICILVLGGVYS